MTYSQDLGQKPAEKTSADYFQNPKPKLQDESLTSKKVTRYLQHSSSACPFPGFVFLYGTRLLQNTKHSHCVTASWRAVFCRHCNEYGQVVLNKHERSWKDARHNGETQSLLQSLGNNSVNCYLAEHWVFGQHSIIIFMSVSHIAQHSADLSIEWKNR